VSSPQTQQDERFVIAKSISFPMAVNYRGGGAHEEVRPRSLIERGRSSSLAGVETQA